MDNYVNSSGSPAAYTDCALIPTAQGSAYGQVNGNRYKLKKLRVRGCLYALPASDQADANTPIYVRVMLVMDTQPNGAQAQGEDIMQDFGAAGENLYSYQRIAQNSGRFRILKDMINIMQPGVAVTDGSNTNSQTWQGVDFNFQYRPKVPIQVNIAAGNSTPTVAGLESCNIFMLAYAERDGFAQAVVLRGCSRAYYCD